MCTIYCANNIGKVSHHDKFTFAVSSSCSYLFRFNELLSLSAGLVLLLCTLRIIHTLKKNLLSSDHRPPSEVIPWRRTSGRSKPEAALSVILPYPLVKFSVSISMIMMIASAVPLVNRNLSMKSTSSNANYGFSLSRTTGSLRPICCRRRL